MQLLCRRALPLSLEVCLGRQYVMWFVCGPVCIRVSACPWWVTPGEVQEGADCGARL